MTSAPKIVRPSDRHLVWEGASGVRHHTDWSKSRSEAAKHVESLGGRMIGLVDTLTEAVALMDRRSSQARAESSEQAEVLIGGLATSVALCGKKERAA